MQLSFPKASPVTVATWASGTNFNNNTFYVATVTLDASQYNLASNAQLRFQCDASANADLIYIDAVTVTGNGSGSKLAENSLRPIRSLSEAKLGFDTEADFSVYPNPGNGNFIVQDADINSEIIVTNSLGQIIYRGYILNAITSLDLSMHSNGIYLIQILNNKQHTTQKVMLQK